MKLTKDIDMLHGPIATNIFWMSIPILLSSVLQQLFNSADMIVVGRFAGSKALAAVGANAAVMNMLINLVCGLSIGSNVVIAQLIGQGDRQGVSRAVHTSVVVAVVCGLLMAVFGLMFAEPILLLIDTPDEVMDDAVLYFRICYAGMPFMLLTNFIASILRAKGDTVRPLYILALAGIINVILNVILVVCFGMGVGGVAIATLISTAIGSVILVRILTRENDDLKLEAGRLKVDMPLLMEIARIGLPTGFQGTVFSFSNVIIQEGINSLGADAMAASTAALNFDFLTYFALASFAQAGMSFLSQNMGAREYARCRRVVTISMLLGVGAAFVVGWAFVVLRYPLSECFSTDQNVIELAAARTLIVLPFYFIHGINETLSALLRAVGYSLTPALIVTVGICTSRMIWVLLFFPDHHTYNFLNACYPMSWAVTCVVMVPIGWWILHRLLYQRIK